ncbi:MAG: type II toxin-antitoxin system VapB family antitoxin [Proteobacteria bacterium]|uniref:type II toxin-antitoxin system VapB family antitoxin n=1 Tax=Nitrosomonas sp. JL21 TaxID=153949 RepID=UPI00136BBCD0|nr:type II toxin-antitoxin system VapB family antitoxin [Nitrosomonas sp. JL21]MBL8496691.1 type II toxin-antitoxin system VapB family antitoxin [Nitrosomonas sp.]MBS0483614.1 type II toxin-antitoxin system VapB family antitoxin [Pseudomonadota bacterium]MCC7092545.1 type II toxin-antitoxin system VapB family antitoxin [Nitrosomonas sp.]MXS76572.1 type II toxin-antitoxin system VapB family antitoxin [Nitrosomonas sp. JL21]
MRTTLDLPEQLLSEAMRVTQAETKTAVIVLALEELVRRAKIAELKQFKGKIELDIDLDSIRARR